MSKFLTSSVFILDNQCPKILLLFLLNIHKYTVKAIIFDSWIFRRKIWESMQSCCCYGEPTCIVRVSTHLNKVALGRGCSVGFQCKMEQGHISSAQIFGRLAKPEEFQIDQVTTKGRACLERVDDVLRSLE